MRYESYMKALPDLQRLLREGKLIVFAGSGVSVPRPSSLPTWDKFLKDFIRFTRQLEDIIPYDDRLPELLREAESMAPTYPARVASALRSRLQEIESKSIPNLDSMYRGWLQQTFSTTRFNTLHSLIVATDYPVILTTNYDNLFEYAAWNHGYRKLRANTFSFKMPDRVAAAIYEGTPCIVHAHGDYAQIALNEIVFTAQDYQAIMKQHNGFRMAIQSLFLTKSALFVGYGGSDPHFEDLVEEIASFLQWSELDDLPHYYLALRKDKSSEVLSRYKNKLRTHIVELDNYGQAEDLLADLQSASPRVPDNLPIAPSRIPSRCVIPRPRPVEDLDEKSLKTG